jgi:Transposase DDE domain
VSGTLQNGGGTVARSVGWPRRSMLRFGKPMPYKFNEGRRHKFPKARYRVTNWPDYDAALVRRGELTVWLTEEAIAAWHAPATGERGGQPIYSAIAIETALTLRLVFHQSLRQTEGLPRSLLCSTSILQFPTTRH